MFAAVVFVLFILYLVSALWSSNMLTLSQVQLLRSHIGHGLKSPFSNLRANHSLSSYLSSCNPSLEKEACSHLSFQRNAVDGSKCGAYCVSGTRNASRFLLHQVEEMLIFARLANVHKMPFVFKNWSAYAYPNIGESFEWMNNFFQLEIMFRNLNSTIASGQEGGQSGPCCNAPLPNVESCDVATILEQADEFSTSDCFKCPTIKQLHSDFAPCLRQHALCHGRWVSEALEVPFKSSGVNLVWYITAGSSCKNFDTCSLHNAVLDYIAPFLRGRKCYMYVIGDVDGETQNRCASHIQFLVSSIGLSELCVVTHLPLSVKESLLYMMTADVVISLSRSLANVASLFSSFPVFITFRPQNRIFFENMFHFLPDVVYIDGPAEHLNDDGRTSSPLCNYNAPSHKVSDFLNRRLASRLASIDEQADAEAKAAASAEAKAAASAEAKAAASNACVQSKAAADAIAASELSDAKSASWPIIFDISLVVVGRHFVDGWSIKGSVIVIPAVFEGSPDSQIVFLKDAYGSDVRCKNSQVTDSKHQHRWANIDCEFVSLDDMNIRMKWIDGSDNASSAVCSCCSIGKTIALSINSQVVYVPPLRRFPQAFTAIVLPTLFGPISQHAFSLWLSHNIRVLGVELVIAYSQSPSIDSEGMLKPLYNLNPGHAVIVNVPQIEFLDSHYHLQHFVINDALLRSMDSIQYVGCIDADEYLEIPPGHNILTYLQSALNCQRTADSSVCSSHSHAAVGIGSFLINMYTSAFDHDAQTLFCKNASIQDYHYLPSHAECHNDQSPEVCAKLLLLPHYQFLCAVLII
jgi:hypothetical protein